MLLQQTVHYLGKYGHLANFPARNFGAAVAGLAARRRIRASSGRFLTAPSLCLPNNLESAAFVIHMKP